MRRATENEVLGDSSSHAEFGGDWIKWGVVGHAGDTADTVIENGDGTAADTGCTLVNVTLFSGRDITKRPQVGHAQGREVRCQLPWAVAVLAPLGMGVLVAFPDGDMVTPGNGVVVATALGGLLAPNWNPGDTAICAASGYGNFVRARYDGRIELSTKTNDGNNAAVFSLIDPTSPTGTKPGLPGFYRSAPWGSETFNSTGWHLATQWGACADFGGFRGSGPFAALAAAGISSTITFRSSSFSAAAAIVKLGAGTGHTSVALAPALATTLTQIIAQVEALATAVTSLVAAVATLATGGTACTPALTVAALGAGLTDVFGIPTITAQLTSLTTSLNGLASPLPFASTTTAAK